MGSRKGIKNRKTVLREQWLGRLVNAMNNGTAVPSGEGSNASKLTPEDMRAIVQMAIKGHTQLELAEKFKVHQSTISRVFMTFHDTRDLAKQRLQGAALQMAETALDAVTAAGAVGDANPALELLDRLDVAPKRLQVAPSGPKVMVVVGNPSPQALPAAFVRELPESTEA